MKRHIFLDASTIRQANFALSSAPFRLLHSLAAHGLIEVLTSDITLSECTALLLEQLEKAINSLKRARAEAQLFSNLGDTLTFEHQPIPDMATVGPQLTGLLHKFFSSPGFAIMEASSRSGTEVFSRYFERRPPFGAGKKKSEFPDAFVLDALQDLANNRGIVIDVVSADKDWAATAAEQPTLRHHPSLSQLMEELQRLPGADLARAEAAFRQERRNLEHAIADIIVNQSVSFADGVGEILSVEVQAVEVEEPRVTTIDDNDVVSYECDAAATLTLDANVPREGSYFYDSEEKRGAYVDWSYVRIEREASFTVDFSLDLTKPRRVEFEHTPIRLNYGRPIEVYLDPDAEDHYK